MSGSYKDQTNLANSDSFEPIGSLLKATLLHSGVEMTWYDEIIPVATSRPDNYQGFGRVQLDTVLNYDNDAFELLVWGAVDGETYPEKVIQFTNVGDDSEITLVPQTTTEFKLTMAYADPVIGVGDSSLSNDIDVVVTHDGTTYYSIVSVSSADSINSVEQIIISSPTVGVDIVVTATATQMNNGPQEIGLVITGEFSSWSTDIQTYVHFDDDDGDDDIYDLDAAVGPTFGTIGGVITLMMILIGSYLI